MKFNLQLTQRRANYTPAMRRFMPSRVNISPLETRNASLTKQWATIIRKTAYNNGTTLTQNRAENLAYYAINLRKSGFSYTESLLTALNLINQ